MIIDHGCHDNLRMMITITKIMMHLKMMTVMTLNNDHSHFRAVGRSRGRSGLSGGKQQGGKQQYGGELSKANQLLEVNINNNIIANIIVTVIMIIMTMIINYPNYHDNDHPQTCHDDQHYFIR